MTLSRTSIPRQAYRFPVFIGATLLTVLLNVDTSSQEITHFITPHRTDDRLVPGQPAHFIALHRDVEQRGLLFLFLPGTGNTPEAYRSITRLAALNGYHAIALSYPNAVSVNFTCTGEPSLTCHESMRTEIIWGRDLSDKVTVDSLNCIAGRLSALLRYLARDFPQDGWGAYLGKNGLPVWNRIVVAGHSQGGGHAAFIAKKKLAAGVIMFSSVDYCTAIDRPAPWLSAKGVTPASRYAAFGHERDQSFPLYLQQRAWKALRLTTVHPSVGTDTAVYPYHSAQALVSNIPPASRSPASETPFHNAVIVDYDTPRAADGNPILKNVWRYLLLRAKSFGKQHS